MKCCHCVDSIKNNCNVYCLCSLSHVMSQCSSVGCVYVIYCTHVQHLTTQRAKTYTFFSYAKLASSQTIPPEAKILIKMVFFTSLAAGFSILKFEPIWHQFPILKSGSSILKKTVSNYSNPKEFRLPYHKQSKIYHLDMVNT